MGCGHETGDNSTNNVNCSGKIYARASPENDKNQPTESIVSATHEVVGAQWSRAPVY